MNKITGNEGVTVAEMAAALARMMVKVPDALTWHQEQVRNRIAVEAMPHPEDAGRMNGAKGAMFRAFSLLMAQAARRRGCTCHYSLRIADKEDRLPSDTSGFVPRNDWNEEGVMAVVRRTMWDLFALDATVRAENTSDKTRLYITLHKDEPKLFPDSELRDALSTVLCAIGANQGRRVFVQGLRREL